MIARPRLWLALLILSSAGLYLLGNGSVALWDRDEPRFAQASRQMLQSGDWVVPHYLGDVRTAKPALIYWCQASAMAVFGDNAFAARFPSALATTLLLILLSIVLWKHIGPERTLWTVFIFATSGLVIAAAKMCITDAVLLLWVTLAQLCLYAMWRGNFSWFVVVTLSVAIGLAGLTKGPVVLGFAVTTMLSLLVLRLIDARFPPQVKEGEKALGLAVGLGEAAIKIITGILIVVAINAPWILMVLRRDPQFFKQTMHHDIWDRLTTPLEQHYGPPGYYLLTIWITFFPWSLLLPLSIGLAIRNRANPQIRFALAAIIGPWILWECIRTKLPHYLLPVFPPLAFLTADALVRCLRGQHNDLKSKGFVFATGVWAILIAIAASGTWVALLEYHDPLPRAAMITLSIFGVAFGATVFAFFRTRRITSAAIAMGVGTMLLITIVYGWYLPRANFLRISPRIADILIDHGVTHPNQVIMIDYMEPSLAFYQGGTIRESGQVQLNHRSIPGFAPWMVVTKDAWDQAQPEIRAMFEPVANARGLAYADKARWMDVMVIRKKTAGAVPD